MSEERKNYRVVFITTDEGSKTAPREELSRMEFELAPVPDTELWQPKVMVHNQRTGFKFTADLPRGFYTGLRAKLEKFNIRNNLDLVVKGLAQLSSLVGDKSSK